MYSVVERGNDIHDLSIYMIYLSENGDRDEFILVEGICMHIYRPRGAWEFSDRFNPHSSGSFQRLEPLKCTVIFIAALVSAEMNRHTHISAGNRWCVRSAYK